MLAAFHMQAVLIENGTPPPLAVSRRLEAAVDSAGQQRWTTYSSVPLRGVERRRAPGFAAAESGDSMLCSERYYTHARTTNCWVGPRSVVSNSAGLNAVVIVKSFFFFFFFFFFLERLLY